MSRKAKLSVSVSVVLCATLFASCSGTDAGISVHAGSPLDEFLGAAWEMKLSPEELARQLEARELAWDELVAECMHGAGFQYLPRTNEGWGGDPRQIAYMESLSEPEFEAWWEFYWGPYLAPDSEGNSPLRTPENSGCQGWADIELSAELDPVIPNEFRSLFDAIEQMNESIILSPEFVELDGEWAYCMAVAGFIGLERPDTIRTYENTVTGVDSADFGCQVSTDYEARATEIIVDVENQFIRDNRAELEAFRESASQP